MNQYKSQYRAKGTTENSSLKSQKKGIKELQQSFPSLEPEVIRDILTNVDYDVERAKEQLYDLFTPVLPPRSSWSPEHTLVESRGAEALLDAAAGNFDNDIFGRCFYDENGSSTVSKVTITPANSDYMKLIDELDKEGLNGLHVGKQSNSKSPQVSPLITNGTKSTNSINSNKSTVLVRTVKDKKTSFTLCDASDLKIPPPKSFDQDEEYPILSPRLPTIYDAVIKASSSSAAVIVQSKSETNVHELTKQESHIATRNQGKDDNISSLKRLSRKGSNHKSNNSSTTKTNEAGFRQTDDLPPTDGDDWFDLKLDKKFIVDVFQTYSSPMEQFKVDKIPLSSVRIPPDLAFQLYNILYLNMRKFDEQQTDFSFVYTPPAEDYTEEELLEIVRRSETESSSPDLQQVMEDEILLGDQQASYRSRIPDTIACKLALKKLCAAFPKISEELIKTCYGATGCRFDATLNEMKSRYGHLFCPEGLSDNFEASSNNIDVEENDADEFIGDGEIETKIIGLRDYAVQCTKASKAYHEKINQQGNPQIAAWYRESAQQKSDLAREANKKAEQLIMERFNSGSASKYQLDLHHLYVNEALKQTQKFLSERTKYLEENNKPSMEVQIITGKGKNSMTSPRLGPSIAVFLTKHNYIYREGSGNFTVILKNKFFQC